MSLSDAELRTLVREAIARHMQGGAGAGERLPPQLLTAHASHGRFVLVPSGDEGRCVIEPAVRCNHCGYCQSYGH